ncbi:phytoene desaturase family protein [Zhihengliuella halotolerans]|uniref:Phytoene dehydrogenase-like protein n=1 Tax=Zhihengliuella halotolerans TaxID=370736 RepID=A0A4Q8AH97_9MICC|nr:NAD(P)/FAD-dependent oxidoreductase [Zhihengliuella halotolerans]RZU63133.1 phytoene dehydrogenase-like protein [Zhihengliuella halotolerans]
MTADAAVVGSGPNGLSAALTLARAGLSVRVYEAAEHLGGAASTIRVDGALHDTGSAVHPTALVSPFFRAIGLADAVDFAVPDLSYAHPLPGGETALIWRSLERTLAGLEQHSRADAAAYRRLIAPLAHRGVALGELLLRPLLPVPPALAPPTFSGTTAAVRLGVATLAAAAGSSAVAAGLPNRYMPEAVSAVLAGLRGHMPGGSCGPAAQGAGLFLGALAHHGWPIPRGGSGAITAALAAMIDAALAGTPRPRAEESAGGAARAPANGRGRAWLELGHPVADRAELDEPIVLFATSAEHVASAVARMPERYRAALRDTRRGPGSAVVHLLTNAPIPWADPRLDAAGTVHLGGSAAEIVAGERASSRRFDPANPYVLLSQPSRFDPARAPAGQHVVWAYTHVPHGVELAEIGGEAAVIDAVVGQVERSAPGFRDTIVRSWAQGPRQLERENPALVGGDITGGAVDLRGMLARPVFSRPTLSGAPWRTPVPGVYLASSSAAPGPAVHGMAGHLAARAAIADAYPPQG